MVVLLQLQQSLLNLLLRFRIVWEGLYDDRDVLLNILSKAFPFLLVPFELLRSTLS